LDGITFDTLILEIETGSIAGGVVNRETLTKHFESRLRNAATVAREIFHDNIDNIIAYGNRHAIAEAAEADRRAKDQQVCDALEADLRSNTRLWRPISKEYFDYMLGSLPPIRMGRGGFVHMEAWSSIPNSDEDAYFVAIESNGICYATLGTLAEWDIEALSLLYGIPKW
jgi:hypothetical protein